MAKFHTRKDKKTIKANALKAGDQIGLVCPGSRPSSPLALNNAISAVEAMGFKPILGKNILNIHGHMAGTDNERLADLNSFLNDDDIAGIFCLTGGFGSLHLINQLNYQAIASKPKVLVGGDDNCHWLLAVHQKTNLVTFHGPNLDQIRCQQTFDCFKAAITSRATAAPVLASEHKQFMQKPYAPAPGVAHGRLIASNLTALVSLMGTPYQIHLQDQILILEDKNERNDILDRWLTTLYVAGELDKLSGLAFGEFVNCGPHGSYNMLSVEELFADRIRQINKPSCFSLPIGQGEYAATVPLGVKATLDADNGRLEFNEDHLT